MIDEGSKSRSEISGDLPSPQVFGDGRPAAEQVGPERLELLTEAQH